MPLTSIQTLRVPIPSHSGRRWPYALIALLAVGGLALGFLGQVMAGSFSVATSWPPPAGYVEHWQRVAYAYWALFLLSLAALLLALAVLSRCRGRRSRALE